jgi:hypothetical protein
MARIYVEIDIQAGLPEILEIDWRSQLIAQRLDYLGIPFHYSLYRRTGHLRRDCSKFPLPDFVLDPAEETNFDGYISPPDQLAEESPFPRRDFIPSNDTLVGKIHQHCPSLFNTFSAWDRLFITEQADKIMLYEPTASLPAQPVSPPLPSPSLPNPPEPVPLDITNIYLSFTYTSAVDTT